MNNRDKIRLLQLEQAVQRAIGLNKPYDKEYKIHINTEDKRILSSDDVQMGIVCGKKYLEIAPEYQKIISSLSVTDDNLYKTMNRFPQEFDDFPGFFNELEQYDDYYSLSATEVSKIICWWLEIGNEFAPYIKAKITDAELPDYIGDARIHIESVIDDTQVSICFDKGLTVNTYKAAWNGLKAFLEKDALIIEEDQGKHSDLDRRILRDWQKGMSYIELSKKYYPDEDEPLNKKDAIAKLVRRSGLTQFSVSTRGKRSQKL